MLALSLSAIAISIGFASPANAEPKASPDVLLKNLKAAVGDNFEVLKAEPVTGKRDSAYWLTEIKAKQPGNFMLRAGKRGYGQGEVIYYFTVAKAGTARTIGHLHRETTAAPMACVGDTLIVPLLVQEHNDLYQFALKSDEKDQFYSPDWAAVTEKMNGKLEIRNGAEKSIKLLKSDAFTSVTRDLSTHVHELAAVFEATAPAKHNLRFEIVVPKDGKEKLEVWNTGLELAVEIVKADEPVRVLVPQWKFDMTRTYVEPATVQLRVGDRLLMCGGEYRTANRRKGVIDDEAKDTKHPPLTVTQKDFTPLKEPFQAATK